MNAMDHIPLGMVFLISVLAQVAFIEFGFRYGQSRRSQGKKAQLAQVRAIMGAGLGLLAFMLAFSFSMAQMHFDQRKQAYMMEVSAIDSAYRGADLIPSDKRVQAKELLQHFTRLRLETTQAARSADIDAVVEMVRESERIHDMLWKVAELSMEGGGDHEDTGIFAQSVLAMINAHDARLQAALFNRISPVIWLTLFFIALLSMVVMGYQAGLTGTRSSLATWALAVTFSTVMTLVIDLDRPNMTLFQMNQQLMAELENRMDGRPGDLP
ncbi:MAG: hypothetical protein HKP03_02830 [Xanthomonadales bacterium]|nr:hypothetical protein [Gammaproteobacteria bacterium]MBT8063819.1 hypothetical protein [Gammaproteobacteria bacterium]NNK32325.1 hypothetical protein [Xanthomonadales bacterium]NNK37388.1 hypothetical protein [Xanthomonadales bacterium]